MCMCVFLMNNPSLVYLSKRRGVRGVQEGGYSITTDSAIFLRGVLLLHVCFGVHSCWPGALVLFLQ